MTDRRLDEALRHLDPPTGFKPWHGGASVLGSLRGITPEVAAWTPYPDRHSIWELVLHIAYWDYAVWRRITDGHRGAFPRSPSDWPAMPEARTEETWREDRRLVREWHDRLADAVRGFDAGRLDEPAGEADRTGTTFADLVTGVVLHETYHAGQIQLMKRLARSEGLIP